MTLTKLIEIADKAYGEGIVMACHRHPNDDLGDTMAKFVATEIADAFDPEATDWEQRKEAARVLRIAFRQIDCVCYTLEHPEFPEFQ